MLDFKPYVYIEGPIVNSVNYELHIILRLPHNYKITEITGGGVCSSLCDTQIDTSTGTPIQTKTRRVEVKVEATTGGIGEVTFRYFHLGLERVPLEEVVMVVVSDGANQKGIGNIIYTDPD